jgi:hypothetical protein
VKAQINDESELVTEPLAPEIMSKQIAEAATVILAAGVERVAVEYGWGCNLNPMQLWQEIEVATAELSEFVKSAIREGVFRLGASDLFVRVKSLELQLLFCHESDIHMKGRRSDLKERMAESWLRQGIKVMTKTAAGEWVPAKA